MTENNADRILAHVRGLNTCARHVLGVQDLTLPVMLSIWGHCGLCGDFATRRAEGSTPAVHMWVCADHADSTIRAEAS